MGISLMAVVFLWVTARVMRSAQRAALSTRHSFELAEGAEAVYK
jgi:hypothetical protein